MPDPIHQPAAESVADRLARLEQRVAALETRLEGSAVARLVSPNTEEASPLALPTAAAASRVAEEIELEVGQTWFAGGGIIALTIGAGFLLSLPYAGVPAFLPSLIGFLLVGVLVGVARAWGRAFELVAANVRGAAMALLFFSALRLFFFSPQPALSLQSFTGRALLAGVVALNLGYAWRRRSPWLFGLALVMGYVSAVVVGAPWYVLLMIGSLAGAIIAAGRRAGWSWVAFAGIAGGNITYFLWAIGNPLRGGAYHFTTEPTLAPAFVLGGVTGFAAATLYRRDRSRETGVTNVATFLNCALGYLVFLLHTAAAFPRTFAMWHLLASLLLLGFAVAFWRRERSRVSTFFYAMTGYAAMTMAIIKLTPMPAGFVWLSLQSLVVVTTAIWFRSRFIVVANFFIYAAIVLGYVFLAERETGISIGFGLVALVSARVLNWQKQRLELQTELMRNAYLLAAFVVFPYALYHLVPRSYVGLAWVALGSLYYGLNFVVRNQKYRWMGHATLLLSMVYVTIVGTRQLEPVYRVLSFLALGAVLLTVSLSFTRARRRLANPRDSRAAE